MTPTPAASTAPRVMEARARCEPAVCAAFAAAGLAYPPGALHLRGYKLERLLEVWAAPDSAAPFVLVATFPILGLSGSPGPKRREGDLQVPEGFYRVNRFNPQSRFYLSLGLDYPNESDRLLATDPAQPGSDIFIHGGDRSCGCLAVGDEALAFLYLAALDTARLHGREITVHLLPCRMDTATDWPETLAPWHAADPALYAFWQTLAEGCRLFAQSRLPPQVRVDSSRAYFLPQNTRLQRPCNGRHYKK